MIIKFPSHLTTDELMADMNRHASAERENVACLIADIAEFDARDGQLAAGYSSLYLYCREVLKLTEFEAYLRIEVARLARRFPSTWKGDGRLRPVAPPPPPVLSAPALPPPAVPRLIMTPLSPGRCELRFTANRSTYDKFEQARHLLSHAVRDRDPGEVLDRALTLLIKDIERRKNGATDRPRPSRGTKRGSRYPSAEVRRIVSKRDGGRCAFVAKTGRRCNERSCVQYHHVDPQGPATPENIQLRCAAHNRYEAGVYGPVKLKYAGVVSERRASYAARTTWSGPSSRVTRAHVGGHDDCEDKLDSGKRKPIRILNLMSELS